MRFERTLGQTIEEWEIEQLIKKFLKEKDEGDSSDISDEGNNSNITYEGDN